MSSTKNWGMCLCKCWCCEGRQSDRYL